MTPFPGKIPFGHPVLMEEEREGEKKSINCRGGVGPDHAISRAGSLERRSLARPIDSDSE